MTRPLLHDGWMSNLQSTRQHLGISGYSAYSTGIVSVCDRKGIFLSDAPVADLPKCKVCLQMLAKATPPAGPMTGGVVKP